QSNGTNCCGCGAYVRREIAVLSRLNHSSFIIQHLSFQDSSFNLQPSNSTCMKVDKLAFGVHPDDVELGCSGTIIASVAQGKKVAVIDLTRGELGTRGSAAIRKAEATNAAKVMCVCARENLE